MNRLLSAALAAAFLLWGALSPSFGATKLVPLARPGVWNGISGIIGFRGKVWFINSKKFVNHNSADLYTYDPATASTRYERSLFSQDAGDPVVMGGLLYWPFEDPRFSARRGEFMATNGREWTWRSLSDGRAFHVHSMIAHRRTLYAAPSAWRAGLQISKDRGATWRIIYDHKTPKRNVSRITSLAILNGTLYAGLTARYRQDIGLLRLENGAIRPLPGWPKALSTRTLAVFGGWLYAVNLTNSKSTVWRTDGVRIERISALDGRFVRDLAAGRRALWAISAGKQEGTLLRSEDGANWSVEFQFRGDEPVDVALHGGRVYVGTTQKGGGALWGEPKGTLQPHRPPKVAQLPKRPPPLSALRLRRALDNLDRILANPATFGPGRSGLLRALEPFALSGRKEAGLALAKRLRVKIPDHTISIIGGRVKVNAADLARWYLLRAMALTGGGSVPLSYLYQPWSLPKNRAEKYFHLAPAAAWAATQLGQNNAKTLDALIRRLRMKGDPPWLRGDFVSALTVLTGKKFAHNVAGWIAWWERERAGR